MRIFPIVLSILLLAACANSTNATPPAVTQPAAVTAPLDSTPADTAESSPTPADPSQTPAPSRTFLPTVMVTTSPTPPPQPSYPNPDDYTWTAVYSGLSSPVGMTHAGDGSGRVFFVEQRGRIMAGVDGSLLPEPFLDIVDRVGSQASEQGLLGLAFHPDYESNGYFYVNYTDRNGDTVIARYSASSDNPDRADPGSEFVLLRQDQPFANHNGGAVVFGPDGYLYLGLGDGGSGGDPQGNAQNTNTWLGKILRIDVDGGEPYAIPEDNPFAGGGGSPEIWAYGLRNPWRLAFDRQTGDLYIGDVGQGTYEEIDFQAADSTGGENYGWNTMEGPDCFESDTCSQEGLVAPVAWYNTHVEGTCSVTGGYVYRGQAMPEWNGIYLFGDFCGGQVWGLLRDSNGAWQNTPLFRHDGAITSFGEDEQGEIYLVDYAGSAYRLEKAAP